MSPDKSILNIMRKLRMGVAAGAVLASNTSQAQNQPSTENNAASEYMEILASNSNSDALTLSFLKNVIYENGEVLYHEADSSYSQLNNPQQTNRRKLRQLRRKNRRKYDKNADLRFICDTVCFNGISDVIEFKENPYLGAYSPDTKQITMRHFIFDKDNIRKEFTQLVKNEAQKMDSAKVNKKFIERLLNRSQDNFEDTKLHEENHGEKDRAGIYFRNLSPQQGGKINMWDEISSKTKELMKQEARWLKSGGQISELNRYINNNFDIYRKAIKYGLIKPLSSKRRDQRAKQRFMINSVARVWQRDYRDSYSAQILDKALDYIGSSGDDKEYRRARNDALKMTFEGKTFYFGNYIDEDVKLPAAVEKELNVRTAFLNVKTEQDFVKTKETIKTAAAQTVNPFLQIQIPKIKFR